MVVAASGVPKSVVAVFEPVLAVVGVLADEALGIGDGLPRAVPEVGVADGAGPAVGKRCRLAGQAVEVVVGPGGGLRLGRVVPLATRLVHLGEVAVRVVAVDQARGVAPGPDGVARGEGVGLRLQPVQLVVGADHVWPFGSVSFVSLPFSS